VADDPRQPFGRTRALAVAGALCLAVGCLPGAGAVTRLHDGMPVQGPQIEPEAYSDYAEGALLEAHGDDTGALAAYRLALETDPDSPELRTRVAAITCKSPSADVHATFDELLRDAPTYPPAWVELSRCHARKHDAKAALEAALHAATLAPLSESATVRVVEALEQSGDSARAHRWREAWRARFDTYPVALDAAAPSPAQPSETAPLRRTVDDAIATGDFDEARKRAVALRLSTGELALRAAELGHPEAALAEAERGLAANPSDSAAWIAAIVAADLSGDDAALTRWLGRVPETTDDLAPAALEQLARVIERRAGERPAEIFFTAARTKGAAPAPSSPPASPETPASPDAP
jgi:tetratricopeptide (TPR) repeat protein